MDYKQEANVLALESRMLLKRIGVELGVNPGLLSIWTKQVSQGGRNKFSVPGVDRRDQMLVLKSKLMRIKKEHDFYKEALAFIEKQSAFNDS